MPEQIPSRRESLLGGRSQGFTLLEVLVTLVVLTGGMIALSQAINTGILASTDVEDVDLALNIAQAKLEEVKNTSFSNIASSGAAADSNFSDFTVTVDVSGTDPKTVTVTVAWNVKGGSTDVALTSLAANY